MNFGYPVFMNLQQKRCVVVGGGSVASRKIVSLLKCKAEVVVIAKQITEKLFNMNRKGRIQWIQRGFWPSDLQKAWLVIAATDDPEINRRIAKEAGNRRQWVNVVDQPHICQFIVPAVVRKGRLALAVSTNGTSPALAKTIKKDLQKNFIPKYQKPLKKISRFRKVVLSEISEPLKRRRVLNQVTRNLLKIK